MATGISRRMRAEMLKWVAGQTGAAFGNAFVGLDTNTSVNDDGSNVTATTTEPSTTGNYSRQQITSNTGWSVTTGALDAAVVLANTAALNWPSTGSSTAAWSTGATTLKTATIWNTATLATTTEAAFCGRAAIATPQAVNATGITLTVAIGGLTLNFTSV